jgi:hypothetical protein
MGGSGSSEQKKKIKGKKKKNLDIQDYHTHLMKKPSIYIGLPPAKFQLFSPFC